MFQWLNEGVSGTEQSFYFYNICTKDVDLVPVNRSIQMGTHNLCI